MEPNNSNELINEKMPFNLAIVGGGKACKFFLELLQDEPLDLLDVKIVGVCDIDPGAEGFQLAKEMGIYTTSNMHDLFCIKKLDGVIELTGRREVLLELVKLRPKGIGVLENNIGRVLRDLFLRDQHLRSVENQILLAKNASDFLIQQANDRISILNIDFTIIEANEAYLKAAGKTKNEVIGAHCYEISHGLSAPCSSTQPELGCPLVETLQTGETANVIHEHPVSGDHSTYCDLVVYPLKNREDEIIGVIEIGRDLTEELSSTWERRTNTLKDDLKKLAQEDRMISLGKLVASCVHEINNPIQGLLTFSHLMKDILEEGAPGPDDLKKFKGHLSIMTSELERCGNIISGLLSFSRKSDMEYRDVDLNEILEAVINLTRHKMELQNIKLETRFTPAPLIVQGDINQLQQCFLNLVFNAIEAMPDGGELRMSSELDGAQKNACMEIQDTGCGLAEENLAHVFDPFFTTKEDGEGTGLGLSIVYGIVKTHKGNIKVQSRVGKGTSFYLDFPVNYSFAQK